MSMDNTSTEKFQTLWMSLIRDIRDTEEKEKEEKLQKLQESLKDVERLIDDGADINKPFGDDGEYREKYFRTPLYYLMEEYYYSGTKYMNNEFLDEILSFLFSKNVVIDKNSINLSNDDRDPKLFEEFLMRADEDNVQFEYKTRSLLLEIMIGFPSVRLDECIPYEFSYASKEDNCIYAENYPYLPIECVLLDYARERGSAITTDVERRDIIRILKRQGSPSPCREKINIMFYKMEEKNKYNDSVKERFQEAIDYWERV
jgi:hypothetical protein